MTNLYIGRGARQSFAEWLRNELKQAGYSTRVRGIHTTEFAKQHGFNYDSVYRWLGMGPWCKQPVIPSPEQCTALAQALAESGRYTHPMEVKARAGYFSEDELLDYVRYHNRVALDAGELVEVSA